MWRNLFIFLGILWGCEGPAMAAESIRTPHVLATIVSEYVQLAPGSKGKIGLHFELQKGWHLYWQNPGDSGEAPRLNWTLDGGAKIVSPIFWPAPERITLGPLANFGYEGEVLLSQEIAIPARAKPGSQMRVKLKANWLVCEEICVPEKGDFEINLQIGDRSIPGRIPKVFTEAAQKIPQQAMDLRAQVVGAKAGEWAVEIKGDRDWITQSWEFFPRTVGAIEAGKAAKMENIVGGLRFTFSSTGVVKDIPADGVLVWRGGKKIQAFVPKGLTGIGRASALASAEPRVANSDSLHWLTILSALLGAFLGGLVLNGMPCVFPILALKAMHFLRVENSRQAREEGWLYGLGVWVSFLLLGGVLLLLRAAGTQAGWGFQLQSPGIVVALYGLFFLLALNFFGLFDWGNSIANQAGRVEIGQGKSSAFWSGVLATAVATPCTAPFMGSALGIALLAPWWLALSIFSLLAAGMALPLVLLGEFPSLAKRIPRPGPWMLTLKQFFGFFLLASSVWLLWVWQKLDPNTAIENILLASILLAFAAWAWEKSKQGAKRWRWRLLILFAAAGIFILLRPSANPTGNAGAYGGLPTAKYSREAVESAQREGRIVYLDFTAAWCLSCQVNKKLVFSSEAVRSEFRQKNVLLLVGDWTNRDPEITAALAAYHRAGVPLNIFIGPSLAQDPEILPALLSPALVLKALANRK